MMVELVLIDDKTDEVFTTVELEQELFDGLVEVATKKKKSVEDIIKEAITDGINNFEKNRTSGKRAKRKS